eukprot:11387041-Ditylum_brightwellii.AAC.1
MNAKDCLNNPFAIVTDHHKCRKTVTTGIAPPKSHLLASEGESSSLSQTEHLSETAVNSFATSGHKPSNAQCGSEGTGVFTNTFGDSNPTIDKKAHDYQKESLKMLQRQNPHENGLRRSLHLQEKREAETTKQKKAHATFGTTKV